MHIIYGATAQTDFTYSLSNYTRFDIPHSLPLLDSCLHILHGLGEFHFGRYQIECGRHRLAAGTLTGCV